MNVLDGTLSTSLLFRMANTYVAIAAEQEDIPALVKQGRHEEQWATWVEQMCHAHRYRHDWNPLVFATLLDMLVSTWPVTLTQRLHWGPMPHYGALGGVSGKGKGKCKSLKTMIRFVTSHLGLARGGRAGREEPLPPTAPGTHSRTVSSIDGSIEYVKVGPKVSSI